MAEAGGAEIRVLPCGERAILVECPDLTAVLALSDAVAAARQVEPWGGRIVDVVPAARTLLVVLAASRWVEPADAWIAASVGGFPGSVGSHIRPDCTDEAQTYEAQPPDHRDKRVPPVRTNDTPVADEGPISSPPRELALRSGEPAEVIEIGVHYDGPDMAEVARLTGLSEAEVIAAHTGTPWRVAFTGFAPGFGYLVGGDLRLAVPRHPTPRPSVPAGSVGLAGEFSGVYPRASPGGWQLIGRTDAVLWDLDRTPPALLRPGVQVRFMPLDAEV